MIEHLRINKGVEALLPRKKEEKNNYLFNIEKVMKLLNYEIKFCLSVKQEVK